jgi:hypothetical protein
MGWVHGLVGQRRFIDGPVEVVQVKEIGLRASRQGDQAVHYQHQ